ncbi:hypothetical protein, conserved [Leishmania tarentolae]|uniref:Uncharacterized protein n=1 Tax=Leishmania tarentolae TaxID=5689 RepID=A0A640KXZ0_LEITA|nr:hypothetical protein, conserved [Leishmania tarentolae]
MRKDSSWHASCMLLSELVDYVGAGLCAGCAAMRLSLFLFFPRCREVSLVNTKDSEGSTRIVRVLQTQGALAMEAPAVYCVSDVTKSLTVADDWIRGLSNQRQQIMCEVSVASLVPESRARTEGDGAGKPASCKTSNTKGLTNWFQLHMMHRRRLYKQYAMNLSVWADTHSYYQLMMWCHDHHVFVHPTVEMIRQRSAFRDHIFQVKEDVEAFTPLLAIPEDLIIGFKDANTESSDPSADVDDRNNLYDAKREAEFHKMNTGENTDADICQFFFASLGMIVSDLITAKSSPLTDPRHLFAELLSKVPTLQNAPYFDEDVVFNSSETCLADVLLQMIRNYINGGPLVNKVPLHELRWAVSVSLSHSTPLSIGAVRSIGIVPLVHLFPHGGTSTNAYVIARTPRENSAEKIATFFREKFGYDFQGQANGKWIYVVPERPLKAGEEISLQAMAPVCEKDSEAEQMWRLSCGTVPESYMFSSQASARQEAATRFLIEQGEALWKASKAKRSL